MLDPEPSPESFQQGCFAVLREGFAFVRGGLEILKIDQNSTDVLCFTIQFGGLSPPMPPMAMVLVRPVVQQHNYATQVKL